MADVLSQEEVDALLKGVQEGEVETETKAPPEGVKPFDFTSKDRVFHHRIPFLERINEGFSKQLRLKLTSSFGRFIDVDFKDTDVRRFSEFISVVMPPASYNLINMNPDELPLLVIIEGTVVLTLVEFFFGGTTGTVVTRKNHGFTTLEHKVIERVLKEILQSLHESWKEIAETKPEVVAMEEKSDYIAEIDPAEHVYGCEFELTMDEITGKLYILYPQQTVEFIKEKLNTMDASQAASKAEFSEWLKSSLKKANLNLSVELDTVEISISELLALKEGDILSLSTSPEDALVMKIEGVPKFLVKAGVHHGSVAVKILKEI
ncbi:MAG: flagellar motor switch protein FliM [Nitrospirae bacterium]|nr:MAG: flagellar motor switch protein FliM [Nitrospirota bacterium]